MWGGRGRRGVGARGVVVTSAAGIREGIVCVVNLLELLGAGWASGVVVGYTVGVVFKGCTERGVSGGVSQTRREREG